MSPRAGLDQEALVAAAADLVDRDGWDALTLAALADKLGVRSPSLYNHVSGLPELRTKLALHSLKGFNRALNEAVRGLAGDEAVYALSEAYLTFARSHPGLYEATVRNQSEPDIQSASQASLELIFQVLKPYGLEGETAIHVVRGLRSLLHGFASIHGKGGFGMPLGVQESLRIVMDTYLSGVKMLAGPERSG